MALTFFSAEDRSAKISVNGGEPIEDTFNSGSWTKSATKEYTIHLDKGYNLVRLYSESAWMPNIDCMKLTRIDATPVEDTPASDALRIDAISGMLLLKAQSPTMVHIVDLTGKTIFNDVVKDSMALPTHAGYYIVNGKKVLVK